MAPTAQSTQNSVKSSDVKEFASFVHPGLTLCSVSSTLAALHNVTDGNGLGASFWLLGLMWLN